jgi:hypothetical protein
MTAYYDQRFAMGITLDLSIQHHSDSRRYIDIVKAGLIDFAVKQGLRAPLFISTQNAVPPTQGESVAAIASFKESIPFRVQDHLARVLNILAAQDLDARYSVLFTDRYNPTNKHHYENCLLQDEIKGYGCEFIFVGLGNRYSKKAFQEFSSHEGCQVFHLSDPTKAVEEVSKLIQEV